MVEDDEVEKHGGSRAVDRNELGESPKQAEYRKWWGPVLEMQFDDPDQEPLKLYYPNNVRASLPMAKTWLTAYCFGGDTGQIGVSAAGNFPNYSQMIERLTSQSDEILAELPEGSEFRKSMGSDDYTFAISKNAADFSNEEEKREWVTETLNAFVNALRPRVKDLL